jgi:thiamine biosynthesis lipoprotein ApbE
MPHRTLRLARIGPTIALFSAGIAAGCAPQAEVRPDAASHPAAHEADTTVYMTEAEALRVVFPDAARVVEEKVVLTPDEAAAVEDVLRSRLGQRTFTVHAGIAPDGALDGFAVIHAEIGKFKLFHFIVGVEPDGRVRRVAVLVYRESRGGEIGQRRFLVQYDEKTTADPLRMSRDIINISGATMSVNSMNHGVKKVLAVIDVALRRNPERLRKLLARPGVPLQEKKRAPAGDASAEVREARYIMGSLCEIRAFGPDPEALRGAMFRAFLEIEAADRALSDYRPESELSELSRAAGLGAVPVSSLTADFLQEAARLSAASGGALDITVGPLVDAWGFRGSPHAASPAGGDLEALRPLIGHDKVRIEPSADGAARVRLERPGMRLDPGALGKGFAADLAARRLRADGVRSALIDFSGNMVAIGAPPGEDGWPVAIRDPAQPGAILGTIRLRDRAVSSSGVHGKAIEVGGACRGHILSPRTLRPVEGVLGAAVVAPTAARADGWSTAACVLGEDALPLLGAEDGVEAVIALEDDGGGVRAAATAGWEGLFLEGQAPAVAPAIAAAGGGSAEEPHLAAGPRGEAYLAWGDVAADGRADILLSRREGGAWLPPVRLNAAAGSAVAGRQVGPRLAVTADGTVLATWVDRGRDPAGDIVMARSEDGGRSFSIPARVNDDPPGAGQEYQDVAVSPDGTVLVVWLDERGAPEGSPNEKQVWYAVSGDGGRTFGPNRSVTSSPGGVCPCCRPAAAASAAGSLHILFRDRAGEDLVLRAAALEPPAGIFGLPVAVSGAWGFEACPVDAPSLLAGPGRSVRAAWMDGAAGEERIWEAVSMDGGSAFGAPRPLVLPAGDAREAVPGRAVLCVHPRLGAVAAWEDSLGRVSARTIDGAGAPSVLLAAPEAGSARSPTLALVGDEVHVAWVEVVLDGDAAIEGRPPSGKLRHAVLRAEDGLLTMVRDKVRGSARP